jgi:hypothetical protein
MPDRRGRSFAPLPPGVVRVRLQGDTFGAGVLAQILRDHPSVEVLTGPDRYSEGRQYLLVRVASPEEILGRVEAGGGEGR